MSRTIALIKFRKTGNIYCGCYNGTTDVMYDFLYKWNPNINVFDYCNEHANDSLEIIKNNKIDDIDNIEIYSDYGGGFYWDGKGSEKFKIIIEGLNPWNDYSNLPTDGQPEWVKNKFAEMYTFEKP